MENNYCVIKCRNCGIGYEKKTKDLQINNNTAIYTCDCLDYIIKNEGDNIVAEYVFDVVFKYTKQ